MFGVGVKGRRTLETSIKHEQSVRPQKWKKGPDTRMEFKMTRKKTINATKSQVQVRWDGQHADRPRCESRCQMVDALTACPNLRVCVHVLRTSYSVIRLLSHGRRCR